MTSQAVVTRIWDLFLWYGRRGPAVLVWVALGILHGCRRRMFESKSLPATVKAVRRHAEGCKTFDELVRQAPVGLNQVRRNGDDVCVWARVCMCYFSGYGVRGESEMHHGRNGLLLSFSPFLCFWASGKAVR